jgi:hypothetical protein
LQLGGLAIQVLEPAMGAEIDPAASLHARVTTHAARHGESSSGRSIAHPGELDVHEPEQPCIEPETRSVDVLREAAFETSSRASLAGALLRLRLERAARRPA